MTSQSQTLIDSMTRHPVIAAVRNETQLEKALSSPVKIIFLLSGSISELGKISRRIQETRRNCLLHLDLIAGLKPDQAGIQFVAEQVRPNGIITTRQSGIKWGKLAGLMTIQRVFLLDSTALEDGERIIQTSQPDMVEVLPGVSEKAIRMAADHFSCPLIAGGLISTREEVYAALKAGALAVSTGNTELWSLT